MELMRIMVSGGGGGFYSSGGGSQGGMGMMGVEESNFFQNFLNTLPPWLASIVLVGVVVLIALIAGKILGRIIGGLLYPDPDKASVLDVKHRIVIFIVITLTIGVSVYSIYSANIPKQPEDLPVSGEAGMVEEDGLPMTEDGKPMDDLPLDDSATNVPESDSGEASDSSQPEDDSASSTESEETDVSSSSEASTKAENSAVAEQPSVAVNNPATANGIMFR